MKNFPYSKQTFKIEVYRTDEALFLRSLPVASEIKQYHRRLGFKIGLVSVLSLLFFSLLTKGLDLEGLLIAIGLGIFIGGYSMMFSSIASSNFLVRIDSSTIHLTQWIFGFSFCEKMKRPAKLRLKKISQLDWRFEQDEKRFGSVVIKAYDYEITWICQLLENFDQEVPVKSDTDETANLYPQPPESGRNILETMQYNGKPLQKIPHPAEISERKIESPKNGSLFVSCSRCSLPLPNDSVWLDVALGVCPHCGNIFQIAELKRQTQPKRHRVDLYENEDGLHLHQHSQWICMLSVCFIFLILLDFSLVLLLVSFGFTLQMVMDNAEVQKAILPFFAVHFIFILGMFITFFSHRYVDFGREKTTFRYRWLFFQYQLTVLSERIGAFFETPVNEFLYGFYIPYGTNHSFRIAATKGELAWLVSAINCWRWRNPPQAATEFDTEWEIESDDEWQPDSAISGILENEKEYIVHCHSCNKQLTVDDFNQEQCSCGEKISLRQSDCYVVEKANGISESELSTLPIVDGFNVTKTDEFLQIEYTSKPRSTLARLYDKLGLSFVFLFMTGLCLSPSLVLIIGNKPPIAMALFLVITYSPIMLMFLPIFLSSYDYYRTKYASWSIRIDSRKFQITRRYKEQIETLVFDWDRIIEIRYKKEVFSFLASLPSPFSRFPSLLCNNIEMILDDNSIEYLPQLPAKNKLNNTTSPNNNWLINQLNQARFVFNK
ncbi:MAG: hypothetical protein LBL62_00440 [Planctomycetaceae bacterium]|jgi:hypothetical protein|nr:hypothetical protein [Planctomycetaceae bacterium]